MGSSAFPQRTGLFCSPATGGGLSRWGSLKVGGHTCSSGAVVLQGSFPLGPITWIMLVQMRCCAGHSVQLKSLLACLLSQEPVSGSVLDMALCQSHVPATKQAAGTAKRRGRWRGVRNAHLKAYQMLLLWFFPLVQEFFDEQPGLQQRLRLGLGLGCMQEGCTGARSCPCGPQGGMPGALQGHVSLRMPPPSCHYCWLFPACVLAWHRWQSPPCSRHCASAKKHAEDSDGKTGVGEQGPCLMAALAGGGRPISNLSVLPKQPLLGQGSGQFWAAAL